MQLQANSGFSDTGHGGLVRQSHRTVILLLVALPHRYANGWFVVSQLHRARAPMCAVVALLL